MRGGSTWAGQWLATRFVFCRPDQAERLAVDRGRDTGASLNETIDPHR